MIGVDKIEDIRRRARAGEPVASIARAVGVSEPTARKYARMGDLLAEPPRRRRRMIMSRAKCEKSTERTIDFYLAECIVDSVYSRRDMVNHGEEGSKLDSR
jgi:predicted transcriptional regulator